MCRNDTARSITTCMSNKDCLTIIIKNVFVRLSIREIKNYLNK